MNDSKTSAWAAVCVKLLQGPIYKNENALMWKTLETYRSNIEDWFSAIALKVVMDEADGFAFLSQQAQDDDTDEKIPRLVREYPLSVELSFLCVILREALDLFDASQSQSLALVMKASEIQDRISSFIPESFDQTKIIRDMDSSLNKLVELTFLKEINPEKNSQAETHDREFEVRRIIRAKIDADFIADFKAKLSDLTNYQNKDEAEA